MLDEARVPAHFPSHWYWIALDGRVYGSAHQTVVAEADTDFQAWLAAGNVPTPWPKDGDDAQTDAALQDVLTPYGLHLSPTAALLAYAAQRRWEIETGGILVAGQPIRTDRESQALINGAYTLAQDQPGQSFKFKTAVGFVTLAAAEIIAISRQVGAHVQACFGVEGDIAAMITAEPPSITTKAEIDAAFAAAVGA